VRTAGATACSVVPLPIVSSAHRVGSGRWRLAGLAVAVATIVPLGAACGSADEPATEGSTHDAYAAVIQWFVSRVPGERDQQVVFVEARGEGVGIDLETQAAVVASTESFADVRFIDDRSEALDEEGVRDDGIALALGPVVTEDSTAVVEADELLDEDTLESRRFDLRLVEGEWVLQGEPAILPS
jgi:hypothetical protein